MEKEQMDNNKNHSKKFSEWFSVVIGALFFPLFLILTFPFVVLILPGKSLLEDYLCIIFLEAIFGLIYFFSSNQTIKYLYDSASKKVQAWSEKKGYYMPVILFFVIAYGGLGLIVIILNYLS